MPRSQLITVFPLTAHLRTLPHSLLGGWLHQRVVRWVGHQCRVGGRHPGSSVLLQPVLHLTVGLQLRTCSTGRCSSTNASLLMNDNGFITYSPRLKSYIMWVIWALNVMSVWELNVAFDTNLSIGRAILAQRQGIYSLSRNPNHVVFV